MKHLNEGDTIEFKHAKGNVKIQAPFPQERIGMIVGGTGITPMIQALHAILGDDNSKTKVNMLYGSKVSNDILGKEMIDRWAESYPDRFTVYHVLSDEPRNSDWKGGRGFITKDMIKKTFAPASKGDDVIVFVCGPPPLYNAVCGPREEQEISGSLGDLGYSKTQVYKF